MSRIDLEIKTAKDRGEVARILIDNGYRCWVETKKKGTGSAKMTVLCVDKPGKETFTCGNGNSTETSGSS